MVSGVSWLDQEIGSSTRQTSVTSEAVIQQQLVRGSSISVAASFESAVQSFDVRTVSLHHGLSLGPGCRLTDESPDQSQQDRREGP